MAELRAFEPSWRDRLASWMMGNERATPERRRMVEGLLGSSGLGNTGVGLVDVTPIGGLLGAQEAARDGDYRGAAMNAMFLGPAAKTANKVALKAAEEMAAKGASREAIWNETGWFKGVDDKWRFEIPDNKALFRGLPTPSPQTHEEFLKQGGDTVGRQLIHDDLFAAYPEARGIGLNRIAAESRGIKGMYQAGENGSMVRGQVDLIGNRDLSSTLLHELQHAVQNVEGFARGGSVGEYASGPMFDQVAKKLAADLSKEITGGVNHRPADILKDIRYAEPQRVRDIANTYGFSTPEDALDFLRIQDEMRTPFGQYRRTAGEVEARNVQKRMDMTADQRRATPPWATQDVPDELQIIRGLLGD